MKKTLSVFTPVKFRLFLIIMMVLIVVLSIAGFYFAQKELRTYADEVSKTVLQAGSSENDLARLSQLEQELERLRSINQRATSIAAESQSYQYQNQIIADLNGYAQRSGLTISQFNFGAESQGATATPIPATPGTPASPEATPTTQASAIKSTSVNVTLNTPLSYRNLLSFLTLIEQNLTKMQVSSISLTKGAEGADTVSTDSLTIEVYIQ